VLVASIVKNKIGKTPDPRVYRLRHISIEILIFILLVILTTALLRPFQQFILNRMTEIRNHLISQAEIFLERNIVYGSIGPSIFGTLDIRDLRIYGEDSMPVMTVSRVRVSYSFIKLMRQEITESINSIRIEGPVITIDTEQDRDLLSRLSVSSTPSGIDFSQGLSAIRIEEFLSPRASIRVRNGVCRVTARADNFQVDSLTLDASLSRGKLRFQGKWNTGASITEILGEPINAHLSLQFSGECAADFHSGNATVSIASFSGDLFQIQPVTVNLALTGTKIELKKINDRAPFDLSVDYDFGSRNLSGVFRCDNFSLQNLLTLSGPWKDYNQWLDFKTSGAAFFVQTPEQGLGYRLDLSGLLPPALLPMKSASFVISGEGDMKSIVFNELSVQIPEGYFRYQGSLAFDPRSLLAPNGILSLSNFSLSAGEAPKVNAAITLRTQDNHISFWGKDTLNLGAVPLADLKGSILFEEGGLTFGASLVRLLEQESTEEPGALSVAGFLDYDPQYLEVRFGLDSFAVVDILNMVRPFTDLSVLPDFFQMMRNSSIDPLSINTFTVNIDAFMATDFKQFSYNVPRFVITGEQGEVFSGDISGTDQYVALHRGHIRLIEADTGKETAIDLSASVNFMNFHTISFSLGVAYLDKPYHLEGVILDQQSISIQGSYGIRSYITMTESSGYSGYMEVENLPIPYREQVTRLSLRVFLRYDSPEEWYLGLESFDLADIRTPTSSAGVFQLAGTVDQRGAFFPKLLFDDGQSPLEGELSLSWNNHFSVISGTITMGDQTGNELYYLQGDFKDKRLSFHLSGEKMQLGRFVEKSFNAVISGNIQGEWNSLDSFSAKVNISNLSAQVSDKDIRLTGFATLTNNLLNLEEMQIHYGEYQIDMPLVMVNRLTSRGEMGSRIWSDSPGSKMDLSVTLGLDFKPIASWFKVEEALKSFKGVLTIDSAHFNTLQSEESFRFIFSRADSLMSLSGGPKDMIRFQISDEGDFYAGLSNPSPIRGTIIGALGDKTIQAQSSDLYVDLTALWRFIPAKAKDIINITGGFVTASLEISGPLGDPEFFGTAQGNSVRLEVPRYLTQEIRPVPITIKLEGNEITFGPIPAAVGSGQGTIAGNFRFDRWVPDIFTLDITVPQTSPIPFGFDIIGIMAYGDASGDLSLSLADLVLTVKGDLTAQNTEIALNAEKLAASQNGEFDDQSKVSVITDITVQAGRKVEFIWPITEFPILQVYASMGTSLKINSNTMTNRYSLVGDVKLQSGEIFYFERSFYLREGVLSFNENDIHFDPRISARAETRDQIDEGPVTISMIIDNAPLQSFTARFESSPPLSQVEIFSLLGQNITGTSTVTAEGNNKVQNAFLASTTDILAQTQVFRRFQRRVQDIFALDMFSFRTQILQNTVLLFVQDQDTWDTNKWLGNYFDNTTVFIGKYITSDMFFQSMLSLRSGENLKSFPGLTWGNFALEPDFGMELRGPFFDIKVTIAPFNFLNLKPGDIAFTLSKRGATWKEIFSLD
jgi:hypothetical protein